MSSPDRQSKLYAANGLTNDMTIVDIASLKAEKSVPVGRLPWGVAVIPLSLETETKVWGCSLRRTPTLDGKSVRAP